MIEILTTRRGNVERTEKLDDYARAGTGEYWIVNPFDRSVEVYSCATANMCCARPSRRARFVRKHFRDWESTSAKSGLFYNWAGLES